MRKATKRGKTCIGTSSRYKTALPLEAKCNLVTCPQLRSCSSKKRGHSKADKTLKKNKKRKTASLRLVRDYIPAGEEAKAGCNVGVWPVSTPCECAGYERGGFMCEICFDELVE